jgi:hypothetical protein
VEFIDVALEPVVSEEPSEQADTMNTIVLETINRLLTNIILLTEIQYRENYIG